jgi:hypothetical protein
MSGYVAIPTDVIRNRSLSLTARVLFGVILSYGWTENGCTASTPTLCSACGIGKTAFYEALTQLAVAELIDVEAGHSSGKQRRIVPKGQGVRIPDFDEAQSPNSGFRTRDSEVDVGQGQVEEVSIETSSSEAHAEPSRPTSQPTGGNGNQMVPPRPTSRQHQAEAAAALCERLAGLMYANDPKAKVSPDSARWREAAERLIRIDERPLVECTAVLEWCQRDPFWQAQILSMPKFREKYPQLRAKWLAEDRWRRGAAAAPVSSAELAAAFDRGPSRSGL